MPEPFDPDLLAAFGRVVILWSYVEQNQGHLLSFLLKAEQARMFVVTQNVSSSTVTDWIRALLQIPAVQRLGIGDLADLLTEIDDARAERNALVHGLWSPAPAPEAAKVQTVRWDRSEIVKVGLVTLDDLGDLLHRVEGILRELRALGTRFGFPV